ncbi:MAG: alkaline phosphatase D family protein [Opitutales bacterium]
MTVSYRMCLLVGLLATVPVVAETVAPLSHFVFGSCAGQDQPQPIWEQVLSHEPQLWIWAGDNVYGDTTDAAVLSSAYEALRAQPGYAALLSRRVPVLATWDDHDYGENDAGREYPMKETSQEIFLDFFGVPEDSPRREREGVYHSEVFGPEGQRVQVILLDTRYHRSPLERFPAPEGERGAYRPILDDAATMLGETQWAWLEEQLREPAELRFIVSSIQFVATDHRYEKWGNLPLERRRLLSLIEETGAEGVVFLSGDRHHAELSRLDWADGYPLYDLTSSGINQSRPRAEGDRRPPEMNRHRLGRVFRGHHFGEVKIDWAQPEPVVHLRIVNQAGEFPIETAFSLAELRFPGSPRSAGETHAGELEEAPIAAAIAVDGEVLDWETGELAVATDGRLHFRFATAAERTLRRHIAPVHVLLDLDGNERTGRRDGEARGFDLEIVFSPDREDEELLSRWGPKVLVHTPARAVIPPDALGLAVAPTHASRWFEIALDRQAEVVAALLARNESGVVNFRVVERDSFSGHQTVLARDAMRLAPAETHGADRAFDLPAKPEGALRVGILNVLWGMPEEEPAAFARIFRALDADVWLLQEWDRALVSPYELEQWFATHVDRDIAWQAAISGTGDSWSGTVLVSRHPLVATLPAYTPVDAGGWDFPVRFAGATIEAPQGRLLAASVHLKAGGAFATDEDRRRLAEADAVNRLLLGMKAATEPDFVVFGGDYNHNGSARVVQRALRLLDLDSSPLQIAQPAVLGRPDLFYTFGRGGVRQRLDYIAYSETSAEAVQAFVLDSALHSEADLAPFGLRPADTDATDHLPVIVDLLPVR